MELAAILLRGYQYKHWGNTWQLAAAFNLILLLSLLVSKGLYVLLGIVYIPWLFVFLFIQRPDMGQKLIHSFPGQYYVG